MRSEVGGRGAGTMYLDGKALPVRLFVPALDRRLRPPAEQALLQAGRGAVDGSARQPLMEPV